MPCLIAQNDARVALRKIGGPARHLSRCFAGGRDGTVAGDDERAKTIGPVAADGERHVAAHGVPPESRVEDAELVQYGNGAGGVARTGARGAAARFVAGAMAAHIDQGELVVLAQTRRVAGVVPAGARPGEAMGKNERLAITRNLGRELCSVRVGKRHEVLHHPNRLLVLGGYRSWKARGDAYSR